MHCLNSYSDIDCLQAPHGGIGDFVSFVSEAADIYDAVEAVIEYKAAGIDIPVYLMPVGGVNSVYEMNERNVADFCRDSGFRFSPRIQVPLYKNAWNT